MQTKKGILKQLFYYFFARTACFSLISHLYKIYHSLIGAAVERGRKPSTETPPPRGAKPVERGRRMRRSEPPNAHGALARGQILRSRPRKSKKARHEGAEEHRFTAVGTNVQINFRSSVEIGVASRAKIRSYRHFF